MNGYYDRESLEDIKEDELEDYPFCHCGAKMVRIRTVKKW